MRSGERAGALKTAVWAAALLAGTIGAATAQQPAAGQAPAAGRGAAPQNQTPNPADVQAMMAALPEKAPAKPKAPRKVLVLGKAAGFVHSSIPLAAKTVEAMGTKTGAWSTTITYDPADINEQNLKQYDAIFLASTTGAFLDDPNDPAATAARKKALLDFVRNGKGLAGIHAATDSYHEAANGTGRMTTGGSRGTGQAAIPQGRDNQVGTWPEWNRMIGAFFKWHWLDPQLITVKIDDPTSPLTAMFHGQEYEIRDETYTFGMNTYSRDNLHILTSLDYSKMSAEDKAKEAHPRADHDYALSWIHRHGKGRVFYEAHGHSERTYAFKPLLEHVLAGVQYAIGDLPADDAPSGKGGTR